MATKKEVTFIARAEFKSDHRKVVYLARSSNGVDQYETSLFDGKATGCSCPSRKPCKHMKAAEQKEATRQEVAVVESPEEKEAREWAQYRAELAKKLAQQYMTTQCVEQIAEQQNIAMELPAELRGYRKTAVSTDTSSLNGAQQSAGLLSILPSRKAKAS